MKSTRSILSIIDLYPTLPAGHCGFWSTFSATLYKGVDLEKCVRDEEANPVKAALLVAEQAANKAKVARRSIIV